MAGRQQFTLPLFWQAVNLDLNPGVKDFLVAHAYTTFFSRTLANFDARYEGRDVRIGRPWNPLEGEPDSASAPPTKAERVAKILGALGGALGPYTKAVAKLIPGRSRGPASASFIDEDGFAHFLGQAGDGRRRAEPVNGDTPATTIFGRAKDEARVLLSDLAEAWRRDWGLEREDDSQATGGTPSR